MIARRSTSACALGAAAPAPCYSSALIPSCGAVRAVRDALCPADHAPASHRARPLLVVVPCRVGFLCYRRELGAVFLIVSRALLIVAEAARFDRENYGALGLTLPYCHQIAHLSFVGSRSRSVSGRSWHLRGSRPARHGVCVAPARRRLHCGASRLRLSSVTLLRAALPSLAVPPRLDSPQSLAASIPFLTLGGGGCLSCSLRHPTSVPLSDVPLAA